MHKNTGSLSVKYQQIKILNWECRRNCLNIHYCDKDNQTRCEPVFNAEGKIKTRQIRDN